jgi:hypothetical protein
MPQYLVIRYLIQDASTPEAAATEALTAMAETWRSLYVAKASKLMDAGLIAALNDMQEFDADAINDLPSAQ